jgi:CHAD domain-containing protein
VLSDGLKFNELAIESKHDLRKRAKRLRYGLQFAESLLPATRLGHYRKSLSQIQDILGEMNDLYVARERFEDIREDQPPAWFAVGWIASRLDVLEKSAFQAFKELKRADQFWK